MSKSAETYNLIKSGLDAASTRSKVISNNIANINTAGYKRYNVSFEENLKGNIDSLDMKTTDSKHMALGNSEGNITINQDNSTSMRADGNNVDIDNEMTNMAANNLMYNAMITEMNTRFAMQKYVVEGR